MFKQEFFCFGAPESLVGGDDSIEFAVEFAGLVGEFGEGDEGEIEMGIDQFFAAGNIG